MRCIIIGLTYALYIVTPLIAESGVWFSPDDNPADHLIAAINSAEQHIYIALYSLTHQKLTTSVKRAYDRGISVSIVLEPDGDFSKGSKLTDLRSYGIPIHTYRKKSDELMHHKFCIIDDTVFTGSMNWTWRGSTRNQENVLWCNDPETVNRFITQHTRLRERCYQEHSTPKKNGSWFGATRDSIAHFLRTLTNGNR